MGCAGSSAASDEGGRDAAADLASQKLEQELERQQAEENRIVKLLVLGTGESGKSTVFKQMKILYSVPDPPAKFIMICRANLFGNAHAVMQGMERLSITYKSEAGKAAADRISKVPQDGNVDDPASFVPTLNAMWADEGVQEAIERASEYQLNDSTTYFWKRAAELCEPNYLPTEQDVLRARVRTTGIVQQNFAIDERKYTMFDVGGQRNERRKWIHCFDNVTAVIFVTAISEYDQVLYEDESTNRMDEALLLFEQIYNHASFVKTSMILFLNKRDLFEAKLTKKALSVWDERASHCGKDYDKCIDFIKARFLEKTKDLELRQVYVHATCATNTDNISFVMESVFDIILKDNLRKMAKPDISALIDTGTGFAGATSNVKGPHEADVWAPTKAGKLILACAWYVDELQEKVLMVKEGAVGQLPAVMLSESIGIKAEQWKWVMGLGTDVPELKMNEKLTGSFKGDFIEGVIALKALMGPSVATSTDLGIIYDQKITMEKNGMVTNVIVIIKRCKTKPNPPAGYTFVGHETFENACYKEFAGIDEPCKPDHTDSGEFNPFAPNPVGHRWFKGIRLYMAEQKRSRERQQKGVYLGVFKVLSTTSGFKVMVNEHNRTNIPMVFLTESQLDAKDTKWMHGVRVREQMFNIDLLEGKTPNMGWLGPEMSGEEGATFPEKLWWAIDEAKSNMSIPEDQKIGFQYDKELLFIDEVNNIQLLLYGVLAKDESDCLPAHIWVPRDEFEVQNMKFNCPTVLQNMVHETQGKIAEYQALASRDAADFEEAKRLRGEKDKIKQSIEDLLTSQTPLKWVDRVIMWCATKMPSFADGITGADANAVVAKAMEKNADVAATLEQRANLIKVYKK